MGTDNRRAWTTPADVTTRLRKRWNTGAFLTDVANNSPWEPLGIPLTGPKPSQITRDFEAVRDWAQSWAATANPRLRVELRRVGGRVVGTNDIPDRAWVDHREHLWKLLGVTNTVQRFQALLTTTREVSPELGVWMAASPMKVLKLEADWPRLHATLQWIKDYRGPAIYLRQIDVPGVDTKFIEQHRAILTTLLELYLPTDRINTDAPRGNFAARFRFLEKPSYVRFRILGDQTLAGLSELSVRIEEFTASPPGITTVYVIENETTYLAFPRTPHSLAIHGGGYAVTQLTALPWFRDVRLIYWGDLDTHGYAILHRLRRAFPHTESILMDRGTLTEHRDQWVREPSPTHEHLDSLTGDESDVYQSLVDGDLGHGVRLEQERVRFSSIQKALTGLGERPPRTEEERTPDTREE